MGNVESGIVLEPLEQVPEAGQKDQQHDRDEVLSSADAFHACALLSVLRVVFFLPILIS